MLTCELEFESAHDAELVLAHVQMGQTATSEVGAPLVAIDSDGT